MNWVLTVVGLAALIVIHEGGHALAARLTGMKVERFALFFPPLILRRRLGETEFALGLIPLGGYVKILGQADPESVAEDERSRSYAGKPVWKRAVVIFAGPLANLLTCLGIVTAILVLQGQAVAQPTVASGELIAPAAGALSPGDRIVSVDGITGKPAALVAQTRTHKCAGTPTAGCAATTPVTLVVVSSHGTHKLLRLTPRYDGQAGVMRLGFSFSTDYRSVPLVDAVGRSVDASWAVTTATLRAVTSIADPKKRGDVGGIVGGATVTAQLFSTDTIRALELLAFISLSIAIVNLLPILPLDGGHLFWLLFEKLRGRPASADVIEKATMVGFALVLVLSFIGLSNDIGRLAGNGFSSYR
jgi:regulator of sigma E protease